MKISSILAGCAAAAALTLTASAQEAAVLADSNTAFSQIQPDATGTVSQQIMHAPAGDVMAVYIGRAPEQVFSKQDELLIVVSGYGTAHVGYPSYDLKPGSVLSIPRHSAFEITATDTPIKGYLIATPANDPNDKQILK
jgi:mannose-6-phosphate isomerase-like protein (cupin superfamily)